MSTDQSPPRGTDDAPKRSRWVVSTIGGLLLVILAGGFLLRQRDDRQPAVAPDDTLTSVASETEATVAREETGDGRHPEAVTPAEQALQDTPPAPLPDDASSDSGGEPASPEMTASQANEADAPANSAAGTSLATLDPLEIDGLEAGSEGPWQPASLSGRQYERALCMVRTAGLNTAQISFELCGKYRQLSGIAGLQDARNEEPAGDSGKSEAVFRIYGDANLLWDSAPQSLPGSTVPFRVDVRDLDYLTLVVEYGARSDGAEPAWADLRLVPTTSDGSAANDSASEP
jgi:hypothetical protein